MERAGEGEMYGESNMATYITICKIDSQWEFAAWLRELRVCRNQERRKERGTGRHRKGELKGRRGRGIRG